MTTTTQTHFLVIGEPGSGKTRILDALAARAGNTVRLDLANNTRAAVRSVLEESAPDTLFLIEGSDAEPPVVQELLVALRAERVRGDIVMVAETDRGFRSRMFQESFTVMHVDEATTRLLDV